MGLLKMKKGGSHPYTAAVIVAAGSGSRFSDVAGLKQNMTLRGMPVIERTVRTFSGCNLIDEIVIVCRSEDLENYTDTLGGIKKVKTVVAGGSERIDSALAGFEAVSDKVKFVAIHDGARCLVTADMIEDVVSRAYDTGAAVAGNPSTDTIKVSEKGESVDETIDRSKVWRISTPQVFLANMYRAAVYMAKKDDVAVTDDSMMAERLGFKVSLVNVGSENIKITNPEDYYVAEGILRFREEYVK